MMLNDVRGTADTRRCVIAVLGHLVAGTCYDETGRGRDVKGVLAIASRADYVDITVGLQDGRYARLEDSVPETKQLIDRHTTHLQGGKQCRYLFVWVFAVRDSDKNRFHLLARKQFVIEEFR